MFFTKTSLLCVQTHSNLLLYYHKSNLSLAHHIEFPQSHEFRQGDHHSQLHEFQVDRSQAILYIYFLNDVFKGVLRKIDFFSLALKTDSYEFFDYRLLGDDIMYVPRESLKCRLLSNPTMNINTLQLQEGSLCFFKPEYESAYVEYVICFVMSTQTLVVFCGQMAIMKSHTAFTQLFFLDTYSKKLVADTKTDNMSLSVLDYDRFTFLQYDHKLSQLSIRIKQMIEPMTLTVFILTSLFEHFDDDLLRDAAEIIDYSP